jgi:type II secretory pathway pseudopilin PulG
MSPITTFRGFTLLETIVATGILVTALAGIAQLFVLSTHLTRRATATGIALVAAQEKIESLRALTFGYDEGGTPITATALRPTLRSSLDENVDASVDWLDAAARMTTADRAAIVRRWKISTISDLPPDTIAIEVCVFRVTARNADHRSADACLSAIRTRQP